MRILRFLRTLGRVLCKKKETVVPSTLLECFNSTRSTEGRDLYLTEIISDIGEFSRLIDCLVVSSSRLFFTFHVFSFKWFLISILIWNGFVEHQNRKNLRSVLVTEHAKLGLVQNCLNSILRWLTNMTILLFTWTFETWYFCFSRKAKGILHDPFGLKLNIWPRLFKGWITLSTG